MRPVRRGASPQAGEFDPYADAQHHLISRLGHYCSYCERPILTGLAVEHIQAKGLPAYALLIGTWTNYLLGCVNCNSTKGDKDVVLSAYLLPDRDNTAYAFTYTIDGKIIPSAAAIALGLDNIAFETLALTGLNKKISEVFDENGKAVAIDRVAQRMEAWGTAQMAKSLLATQPRSNELKLCITELAKAKGFFSIWMTVFDGNPDMRNRFIDAFPGTRASGCYDPVSTLPVSPSPNPDALANGAKL
ncbi:HNH endonuclease [Duganella sp. LX20W]|uniref:HNH endonuclease n=1 Tax=Rugamonas brunnea TaxID=2758569 RepID=A0A7W2EPC1_9BURK|nr:HNH endonuclease [Rugamonas brunnea]MBA5636168.1 HNH endonuclease [Rugamonas brunnea]